VPVSSLDTSITRCEKRNPSTFGTGRTNTSDFIIFEVGIDGRREIKGISQ